MGRVTNCPDCGKIIALIFPMHNCSPTPNFKKQKREERKLEKDLKGKREKTRLEREGR